MEINEIGRRIVGRYWWLIAVLVALGAAAAAASSSSQTTYTASARIVLDTPDPATRAESTAISDTVKAIATSPSAVRAALRSAHVRDRDPVDIADNHVAVTGLGSSAVVKVSVSDKDPRVAADVANALAARVIATRRDVTTGGIAHELTGLNKRLEQVNARIADLDAQIAKLDVAVANASNAADASDRRAERDAAERRRDFLTQQRGLIETERVNIIGSAALRPQPSVISEATVPRNADASRRLPSIVLGALLGFVLGLGIAALAETLRPTVVGSDPLAREFDAPLLGELRATSPDLFDQELASVVARVQLAADAADVDDVALVAATDDADLRRLVARLEAAPEAAAPRGARAETGHGATIRMFSFAAAAPMTVARPDATGVVVIAPTTLKKRDVVDVGHLLQITRMPLLGLITYAPRQPLVRRLRRLTPTVARPSGSTSTT